MIEEGSGLKTEKGLPYDWETISCSTAHRGTWVRLARYRLPGVFRTCMAEVRVERRCRFHSCDRLHGSVVAMAAGDCLVFSLCRALVLERLPVDPNPPS